MLGIVKKAYVSMAENASEVNRKNILSFVRSSADDTSKKLLDLGCHDGNWTMELAKALQTDDVHGVELVPEAAAEATARGVTVSVADLNAAFPLPSGAYDVVHANQVIEHVSDVDLFVSEIARVLSKGGVAIISTENASSWHNIFASVLGWQIFSLTNVSGRVAGLGNPFAVHRGAAAFSPTWRHKTIMSYLGLIELFQVHGFAKVDIAGAGYYPLPGVLGRLDPRHSAFITVKATKA